MGRVEGLGHLSAHGDHLGLGEGRAGHTGFEGLAAQELHGEEGQRVVQAVAPHRDDARVHEPLGDAGLAEKPLHRVFAGEVAALEHLHRGEVARGRVAGTVDVAHRAAVDAVDDGPTIGDDGAGFDHSDGHLASSGRTTQGDLRGA